MNSIQNHGIKYNVSMKGGTHDILSKIERAQKVITLDKFVKEVTPLMDESGAKLDLNKLSDNDLEFIANIKKWVVKKYSEGIENLEGLKKYFSTEIGMRQPLLYNETNGVYNGVDVIIGTPVKSGKKYIKIKQESKPILDKSEINTFEDVLQRFMKPLSQNEFGVAKKLGLKSKLFRLPKLDPFYDHYKEVVDTEGRVLKRDIFRWDNDEKAMFCVEKIQFEPEEYVRSYDIDINSLSMSERWDKELIDEYNCLMHYRGNVRPDIVAELRKRGILSESQLPEFIK